MERIARRNCKSNSGRDYRESALMGLQWLFNRDHYQGWLTESSPDTSYYLYCYPSKIIGAVINSMLMYAAMAPADSLAANKIAINAGYYLVNASKPAGSPLEFFPPTYDGDFVEKTDPAGDSEHEYAKNKTIEIRDQLDGWINCATTDARAMLGLADLLDKLNTKQTLLVSNG